MKKKSKIEITQQGPIEFTEQDLIPERIQKELGMSDAIESGATEQGPVIQPFVPLIADDGGEMGMSEGTPEELAQLGESVPTSSQDLGSLSALTQKLALAANSTEGFEYVSSSTIDNPPEVKEERTKPANQTWKGERYFLVNLILKLTPTGGQAVTIPVFCETTRGTMVEEMIELAMQDKRTLGIIRSVLDNPKDRVAGDEIDEDPQGKLF